MGLLAPSTKKATRKASQPAVWGVCACKDQVQILRPKLAQLNLFRGKGEVILLKLAKCKQSIRPFTYPRLPALLKSGVKAHSNLDRLPTPWLTDLSKKWSSTARKKGQKAL